VRSMVEKTLQHWGRIDVLFNNAGSGAPFRYAHQFDLAEFETSLRLHLASAFLLVKYVAPHMVARGSGAIINNASSSGVHADGNAPAYACAKAGLIQATKCWALELAPHGVRVNTISPGAIMTPIWWGGHTCQGAEQSERMLARLTRWYNERDWLNERVGLVADVAAAALFLASDESVHISAHNLLVDFGVTSRAATRSRLEARYADRAAMLYGDDDS